MVKIIADSTCDLGKELIERYGVTVVPLYIHMGDAEYRDGVDITVDEMYEWADANETTPKTAAASITDAVEAIEPFKDAGDDVVVLTISESMSTTANVFRLAADELDYEDHVFVVDSANLSTGGGLLVIEAAIMAQEGKSAEEIVARLEELKPLVRASFVVDILTYLHRGGRCSATSALVGGMLKLKPRIVVEDGKMDADKKYRGTMKKVLLQYTKDMEEELKVAKKDRVFITHSGCSEDILNELYSYLESLNHFDEILVTRAGGVISSHCGPGTLGVLFIANEAK